MSRRCSSPRFRCSRWRWRSCSATSARRLRTSAASISPRAWIILGIVIAGPTVVAYLLQAWALRYADSSLVAAYTYVQPVLASFFGAMFLGEQIRPVVVLAAAM